MNAAAAPSTPPSLKGLDSLRFIAAAAVAISHDAYFPFRELFPNATGLGRLAIALQECAFNGPAAVVIFFVISGLVIHYGQVEGGPLDTPAFLVRRIMRVLVPLLIAYAIGALLGPGRLAALKLVLWSLYCELIYYLIYPLLRRLFARIGLVPCIAASFAVSAGLLIAVPHPYHWQYPIYLLWLVPFPAWLLGCLLAETVIRKPSPSLKAIWLWRAAVWAYAVIALLWFYHGPIKLGHPVLLAPYPLLVFGWIRREIAYYRVHDPVGWLERAGRWSYSLYLVHPLVFSLLPHALGGLIAGWALRLITAPAAAFLFFLTVENPAHKLARGLSRRIARR